MTKDAPGPTHREGDGRAQPLAAAAALDSERHRERMSHASGLIAAPGQGRSGVPHRLAKSVILDELLDLSLYRALAPVANPELRATLEQLIPIEKSHFQFWQDFFGIKVESLDVGRRIKFAVLVAICRLFGSPAIHLVLEAIEVYGVRKYLKLWRVYGHGPLGPAVREVLDDEFRHEDTVVRGSAEHRISPERIRNLFLGFNDGLVEILGAVSGFFAAFQSAATVLIAASTVAVAGALSMAAGAYAAGSSEDELRRTEEERQSFLTGKPLEDTPGESPLSAAMLVGISYLAGAIVPVIPVFFGAKNAILSLVTAGSFIILVSLVVAFISGMEVKRRILTNVVIIAAAVSVTYLIGAATRAWFGIEV